MIRHISIQSKDNALVKHVVKLGQSSSYRQSHGLGVVYGEHVVTEAHKFAVLESVIIEYDSLTKYQRLLDQLPSTIKIYITSSVVMHKLNLSNSQIDIVGLIHINSLQISQELYGSDCVVLENIQDPGNLGTIMRSCAACGFKNIVLSSGSVDIYNPKVLRASQGLQFGLAIYSAINVEQFLQNYTGIVIGTIPSAPESIYQADLTKSMAWVFGNEGNGISLALSMIIKNKLSIPMQSGIESLNVAMAATVCLFETYRQRLTQ